MNSVVIMMVTLSNDSLEFKAIMNVNQEVFLWEKYRDSVPLG